MHPRMENERTNEQSSTFMTGQVVRTNTVPHERMLCCMIARFTHDCRHGSTFYSSAPVLLLQATQTHPKRPSL